jgi:tetratricopeptide (TPR) repeat protein
MRKIVVTTAAGVALGFATACFAMGGMGGGGGGMGGYGGGNARSAGFDEYTTAVRLIHHEKYAEAVPYLNRALQEKPNNADVLNYLGYTHRMLGDYPGSLDFYQRALARDPEHKGAHEYLGELYLKMNQLASARAQLDELSRLCPDSCEEKDVLTKAITEYQLAAAAPAAPAATPTSATAPAASARPAAAAQPATAMTQPAAAPQPAASPPPSP